MAGYQDIQARQIWTDPIHVPNPHCEGYRLSYPGTITLNDSYTIVLEQYAVYQTQCADSATSTDMANSSLPVYGLSNPFEASVVPQMFVLGAMLVIAWSLVIILVITPRTSFILGTGVGHLGSHNGNSATIISIGGRPWLQKFAALTVGVSLFIATVNSFKIIEQQYEDGYQDALAVTRDVVNSYEVRIIRVISTTFVWLAQIQTLIRLFPRHREKVIIKWAGFGLIILDTIFVILNNFVAHEGDGPKNIKPRAYTEVIPVLSYLFELSLNLLYAAWVIYYSIVKRRFAFFHPQMKNIAVMALLSYASVAIPVVFFITDIAKSQVAAWGDYIRWVGSAAASVVVWEWVERIEALEREERKNGILGREIFDGDEFSKTPSLNFKWPTRARSRKGGGDGSSMSGDRPSNSAGSTESQRTRVEENPAIPLATLDVTSGAHMQTEENGRRKRSLLHTFLPPTSESPIPRSDTGSAASTVYAIVRHPPSASTTPAQDVMQNIQIQEVAVNVESLPVQSPVTTTAVEEGPLSPSFPDRARSIHFLPSVANPFKRRRSSPPPEVSRAAVDAAGRPSQARWSSRRSPKNLFRLGRTQVQPANLPIVVVPAQPRGQIWTPPTDTLASDAADGWVQEARPGEVVSARSPLSLDGSIRESPDIRATNGATDRDSPNSALGRNGDLLTTSSYQPVGYPSDRASPRSILPRVDEQSEHNAYGGSQSDVNRFEPARAPSNDRPAG